MSSPDQIDRKIIEVLKEDARISFVSIGKTVGLSEAAVRRRVRNLVKTGAIKRFTVEVDLGPRTNAITLISCDPSVSTPTIAEQLKGIEGIQMVYEITGQYDIAVFISAPNIAEVNRCVDEVRRVHGVSNTNTTIVLRTA